MSQYIFCLCIFDVPYAFFDLLVHRIVLCVAVANITHYTLQINQTRAQQRYDNLIQPSIFRSIYKNEKQNKVIAEQQVPASQHLTHLKMAS
jgi:hypothetical protein